MIPAYLLLYVERGFRAHEGKKLKKENESISLE